MFLVAGLTGERQWRYKAGRLQQITIPHFCLTHPLRRNGMKLSLGARARRPQRLASADTNPRQELKLKVSSHAGKMPALPGWAVLPALPAATPF
jgi:hypothetical protein